MKLKGTFEKLSLAKLGVIAAALTVVMLALRFYQLTALTDPATGFFTDHKNVTVLPFYVLAVGAVLCLLLLAWLAGGVGSGKTRERRDLPLGVASLVFAVPLAMAFISGAKEISANLAAYYRLKEAVEAMGGYISVLAPLLALLSAVAMLLNGISFLTGKFIIPKLKILLLCPALWAFFLTIEYFKITVSYVKVSQLMLTIFADAFLMIFLFEYARLISGIGILDAIHAFYGSGLAAAFLLLSAELPNLYFQLFAPEKLVIHCQLRTVNLAAALFVIAAMLYAARNGLPARTESPEEAA